MDTRVRAIGSAAAQVPRAHQAPLHRVKRSLGSALQLKLAKDVAHVGFNRLLTDPELTGNLPQTSADDFRVDVTDAHSTEVLWRAAFHRRGDIFGIRIPRGALAPGNYQIQLFGINGAREEKLATYTLRVQSLVQDAVDK